MAHVDVRDCLARPAGEEVLTIRRGRRSVAPDAGERQGAVHVDQAAQRLDVGGLGDVPVVHEREAAQARAAARVGHAGEAEVDAVCQQAGEQRRAVVAGTARPTVGEALRKASPGVDVHEHVRDAGARQAVVERAPEHLDRGRRHGARRGDGQARGLETDVRQLAGPCAGRDDDGQLLEPRAPLGQMLREDRRHRQRQRSPTPAARRRWADAEGRRRRACSGASPTPTRRRRAGARAARKERTVRQAGRSTSPFKTTNGRQRRGTKRRDGDGGSLRLPVA